MAKKNKNYVKDKQPKTLWNKIGPFVKLREYLASNITPDVYANERGLKTKIMEFFGQDVPKANVDDFSQNLWFRFLKLGVIRINSGTNVLTTPSNSLSASSTVIPFLYFLRR